MPYHLVLAAYRWLNRGAQRFSKSSPGSKKRLKGAKEINLINTATYLNGPVLKSYLNTKVK
ncbi:MAG: hypothetical protein LBF97_07200 [Elusimicrobiota bacterium]|nr:hypothetical protein [Elusimicrobiota bacterium]